MLYLICAAALPNARTPAGRDMRQCYLSESRYFFALVLLYILATLAQTVVVSGAFRLTVPMSERLAIIAVLVPLLWLRRVGYHWFATLLVLAVIAERLFEQALR